MYVYKILNILKILLPNCNHIINFEFFNFQLVLYFESLLSNSNYFLDCGILIGDQFQKFYLQCRNICFLKVIQYIFQKIKKY